MLSHRGFLGSGVFPLEPFKDQDLPIPLGQFGTGQGLGCTDRL